MVVKFFGISMAWSVGLETIALNSVFNKVYLTIIVKYLCEKVDVK